MARIELSKNEPLDSAIKRFKIECSKDGLMSEIKKRKYYEKPSVKRKKKADAAKKKQRRK